MRNKVLRAATSCGAVALILAGSAYAGAPVNFDTWSVSSGTVTLGDYDSGTAGTQTCPSGFTCNAPVTGDGFMQRQIVRTADSKQFFQTIVTDLGVTGAPSALSFSDETFVQSGTSGLAGKQRALASEATVSDLGASTTVFSMTSSVLTGWAQGAGEDKLTLSQGLSETLNAGGDKLMNNSFSLAIASDNNFFMTVDQAIRITPGADTGVSTDDDLQRFVMQEVKGSKQTTTRVVGDAPGELLWSGDDIAWSSGNDIKVIWVGQQLNKSGGESFAFQSYENVTNSNDLISEFKVGSTLPNTWVSPFTSSPTMTVP